MIMIMKHYNVVWADDEAPVLLDDDTIENLKDEGIYVIEKVTHSEKLGVVLDRLCKQNSIQKPDAVIVDANFSRQDVKVDDTTIQGLNHSLILEEKYKSIPFFLYTKRKKEILKKELQGGLDHFEKENRWFEKGSVGFDDLIKRIKEVVDERATPEFILRNKYPREFEVAKQISGAESTIFKSLLIEMDASDADSVDYYNSLRKVIEGMFEKCKENKIIPPIAELNGCCTFLEKKHADYYIEEGEKIMHEALVYALRYALDMTQDGSHNGEKKGLKLKTDEYAREAKSNHVFSSILHITMDLLLWFGDMINSSDEERASLRWNKRNLDNVTIDRVERKCIAYAGGYTINVNRDHSLKKGDVVQIKKVDEDGYVDWRDYSLKS